jgi:CheY-like chemotaxis protein
VSSGSIFIVDDNPNNLSLLAGILRDGGYEVRIANSGRRALAAIRAEPPELVLLDINMPDLSGFEVCRELKAGPATAEIPVVFLSALDDVADKVSAFDAGGVDYVTKPFHTDEVLVRVATQLRLSRLRLALEQKNAELQRRNQQLQLAWRDADHVFASLSDSLSGTVLDGRYRLEQKIGSGGFAAIYRGHELAAGRPVAVKILRPDSGRDAATYLDRFRNEGLSAMRLSHPNAVAVLDSGVTSSGVAFLVMELLEGRSLAEELERTGPLSLRRCAEIVGPLCAVLAHAHGQGILHRDIKPANVFLHQARGGEVVKVVDFGIAKLFDEERHTDVFTTIGRLIGTPVYMSPERLLGKPHDERADSYGVGVTLYQMISGRLPFEVTGGNLGAVVMTCLAESATPLRRHVPDCPAPVEALVMRAIAKRPEDRPRVADLAAALAAAVEGGAAELAVDRPLGSTVEITS